MISAAVIQVDYDLNGNQFVDLFNLEEDAESIVYSVLTSECGGAVVFCWPKEFECSSKFVESFDRIDDLEKGDIFVQYCFLSSEHTFFARKWWDRLTEKQRKNIFKLHECTFYEGGKFVANESPLVDWVFCST